jgi:hypothetical protein
MRKITIILILFLLVGLLFVLGGVTDKKNKLNQTNETNKGASVVGPPATGKTFTPPTKNSIP